MKRFFAVVILFVLLLGVASCKKVVPPEEDVFFQVQFITTSLPYDVTPPETLSVKQGECAVCPTLDVEPTAGYVVIWTTDLIEKAQYDFSVAVTENLTLYAVEVPRTYRITYLIAHGKNVASNVTSYSKATETFYLQTPKLDFGYKFIKWAYFNDPDSKVESIEKGSEGDLVLRAVTQAVEYDVYYDDPGDSNPNPATYVFGTTVSLESPLRDGYEFRGYTIAEDPKNTPVTTLEPSFIEANKDALFYKNGVAIWLKANWEKNE